MYANYSSYSHRSKDQKCSSIDVVAENCKLATAAASNKRFEQKVCFSLRRLLLLFSMTQLREVFKFYFSETVIKARKIVGSQPAFTPGCKASKAVVDGQAVLQPHCPDFSVTPKHMLNRAREQMQKKC